MMCEMLYSFQKKICMPIAISHDGFQIFGWILPCRITIKDYPNIFFPVRLIKESHLV